MNDSNIFDPIVHDALRDEIQREDWYTHQDAEMARKEEEAMDWFRGCTKRWQDNFIADAVIAHLEAIGYWDGKR